MILQALVKYYEELVQQGKAAKPGWCQAKVSHAIELNADGTIKTIISLKKEEQRGKKKVWVPEPLNVPEMVTRSSGIASNFLCDNAKYFLGIDAEGTNQRVIDCFHAAREKHLAILGEAEGEMAKAICLYFKNWNPEQAKKNPVIKEHWEELNEGGNIIFSMKGIYAQEDDEIKKLWDKLQVKENSGKKGICLVTGQKTEIARIHRGIKGVPGAQSSGAALVSFNAPSFESYGKEQSYNAPVGKYAEFAYTTALNYLLSQREYQFPLGDSMIVFWAESGKEEYQKTFLSWMNPKPDNQKEMRKVFGNLEKGLWVDLEDINLDPNQPFYILCLAPNAARLSVRFFYQNSFGTIIKNISRHYQRMEIVKPSWVENEYLGVKKMLDETVNQKSKDKTPVPNMALNEECIETSYVLGRIFAVLESIQKDANPGINATIRDRYFNSACATPASIFPVLIKLKNSHIKKIDRESVARKIYYEKVLADLMGKLDVSEENAGIPKRLSLEEQGRFMLGYYHQIQKKYEKKEDK